ncbi:MAG: hypothetical protein AAF718_07850 [Pseudomonadota bacterium]
MYSERTLASLSPEQICAFIVERLKAALPGMPLEPGADEPYRLTLSHPETGELVLNLGNLVQEVRGAAPHAAERLVDSFVTLAQRAVAPPSVDLKKVYPGLRHCAFRGASHSLAPDALMGDGPGDLISVVLSDEGGGVATLSEAIVRSAGQDVEKVLLAAEQNFVDLLPNAYGEIGENGSVLSMGVHGYDWLGTSLMFVPSLISNVMEQQGWDRVLLAAPNRETIDLINASERGAVEKMERWMKDRLAGPRTQSDMVFTYQRNATEYRKSHLMIGNALVTLN